MTKDLTTNTETNESNEVTAGNLVVVLAQTPEEVLAAQKLRYRFFSGEENPAPDGIDEDAYDAVCDHLLVKDLNKTSVEEQVVGTYRMIRRPARDAVGRFYSASEFDISKIESYSGELLELGRSCVAEAYRSRATMQLLWRGLGMYVAEHNVKLMFGCGSFDGVDPQEHALALSYLHHFHMAPEHLRTHALPPHAIDINMIPKDQINPKYGFNAIPALLKGYLRAGGIIGDGAFIDHDCKTIDVCIMIEIEKVTDRYFNRFGKTTEE